jgi:hypothetical protein
MKVNISSAELSCPTTEELIKPLENTDYYTYHFLTLRNSTFWPQSALMFVTWFSKYTVTVSLNSINQLVFVKEMQHVFCEAGTEF